MKINKVGIIFIFGFVLAPSIWASPAQVLIIRHGEKDPASENLSPAGYARAQAIVNVFETNQEFLTYGTPVAVYAMAPDSKDPTMRPIETVTPLAQSLLSENPHVAFVDTFAKDATVQAAQDVMQQSAYAGKTVLMCWEHKAIADLLSTFGVTQMPAPWPDTVFGRVYMLNFNPDGSFKSMTCSTELPADSQDCQSRLR